MRDSLLVTAIRNWIQRQNQRSLDRREGPLLRFLNSLSHHEQVGIGIGAGVMLLISIAAYDTLYSLHGGFPGNLVAFPFVLVSFLSTMTVTTLIANSLDRAREEELRLERAPVPVRSSKR